MKATQKEETKALRLLKKCRVKLEEIERFSFMQRYTFPQTDDRPGKVIYGPGIMVLHLKDGNDRLLPLSFSHPTSMVHYLLSRNIPFDNYQEGLIPEGEIRPDVYKRPSLYKFYFFLLFISFLILGYYLTSFFWWGIVMAVVCFGLSLFFLSMLQTRFCYISLDKEKLTVHSAGRTLHYPYNKLRKVNFDFAREQNFTHIMEILDSDYRYRLFYIGLVPRTKLKVIARQLQKAGIDATCSLNDKKRYYHDTNFHH